MRLCVQAIEGEIPHFTAGYVHFRTVVSLLDICDGKSRDLQVLEPGCRFSGVKSLISDHRK